MADKLISEEHWPPFYDSRIAGLQNGRKFDLIVLYLKKQMLSGNLKVKKFSMPRKGLTYR